MRGTNMNIFRITSTFSLFTFLCGLGLHAEERMSTALLTTGESSTQDKRVHQTEIPWFVWYQGDSSTLNVTGGSFTEIDAYAFNLSQTTFNNREVTTSKQGGELDEMLLTTSEFSRLGASSQYLLWLSKEKFGAENIENIIAGHVDIALQKPLEAMPGLHVNAAGSYNTNSDDVYDSNGTGGQSGVSYAEHFFEDTLGVMFLSSYEILSVAEKSSNAWYGPDYDEDRGATYGWMDAALNGLAGFSGGTSGGSEAYSRNNLGLQWQPSSSFEVNFDVLYSTRDADTQQHNYEISGVNRDSVGDSRFSPILPLEQTEAFQGAYSNSAMQAGSVSSAYEDSESLLNTGLSVELNYGLWTIGADVEYSLTKFDSDWKGVKSINSSGGPEIVTLPGDGSFGFNKDLLNLTDNMPSSLRASKGDIEDELKVLGLDFKRELRHWLLESLEFGVRGSDRSRKARYLSAGGDAGVAGTGGFGNAIQGMAQSDGINYLIFDVDRAIANNFGGGFTSADFVSDTGTPFIDSGDVDETTTAGYTKFNFSRKFGNGFGLIGNVGLRAVSVQTESDGTFVNYAGGASGVPQSVNESNNYKGLLPSLNLTLFPEGEKYAVGLSASRRIAKAPMDMLSASTKIYDAWTGANPGVMNNHGEGGNPALDPWEVNQFDLSFDWYFMDFAYISAVGSYKYLDTYIAQDVRDEVIDGTTYSIVRPQNMHGASISSFTLRYSQPFTFIPEKWGEMGLFTSAVVTDSDATETARDPVARAGEDAAGHSYSLVGLADFSTVTALWYSVDKWDFVLRHKYRSEYTTKIDGKYLATVEPGSEFDFRVAYSPTKKLSIVLEAKNLTNEGYSYYYDNNKSRPGQTLNWGRSYVLGVNYTF
jgi:iron complex outermembrane receptor protein